MQLTVSGHHLDITNSIHDYVSTKLSKLQRHHDRITSTNVILTIENKTTQKAEATLHVAGGDLFANASSEDLYAAIDLLADKLDRQLIKHKEKHRHH